jgi:anti-sigma factor RsiW
MERQAIERLAMDHALGELNEDTERLFETYLAEHPQHRPWAEQVAQTCRHLKSAVEAEVGAMDEAAPRAMSASRHMSLLWGLRARWAAVIALSVAIGCIAGRWTSPQTEQPPGVIVRAESPEPMPNWQQRLAGSEPGFWQTKALAILEPRSTRVSTPAGNRDGLWDRYRQFKQGAEL